jgi:hypothetical protein
MTRNIKRIAHDLSPLSNAASELGTIILKLLKAIEPHANFTDDKANKYFHECIEATRNLSVSTQLIGDYIADIDKEADNNGIAKD